MRKQKTADNHKEEYGIKSSSTISIQWCGNETEDLRVYSRL